MKKSILTNAVYLLFAICFAHNSVNAAALDPNFGTGGKTYQTSTTQANFHGNAILIQPDGKILLAGYQNNGQNPPDAHLLRYNSNGTLDTSFGVGGWIIWGGQINSFRALSAALQSDGKIVLVGPGPGGFNVFRALANGNPDPSFGTSGNGMVIKNIGGGTGYSVVIQADGKIVVGGSYLPDQSSFKTALIRLNSDGTTDNSFGPNGNGIVTGNDGPALSLVQGPDGSLFCAANREDDFLSPAWSEGVMRVAKFSANGILDTSFGTGGYALMGFGAGVRVKALEIAIQPDGKIVAAGGIKYTVYANPADPYWGDWAMGRFNSDGSIDTSFGINGGVKLDFVYRAWEVANTLLIEPNGNILVAGKVIARFSPNGTLLSKTDPSSIHDPGRFVSNIYALARQADGKILAAGEDAGLRNLGIARYDDITSINNSTPKFDFDGDTIADIGLYRPGATAAADSYWYGTFSRSIGLIFFFSQRYGVGDDLQVPGDYDGDRRTDYAVFRPSDGNWYSSKRPDGDLSDQFITAHWGQAGDIPAPGDFDGDGITDRAVFRPSNGGWYILNSTGSVTSVQFGLASDKPAVADYDNDGRVDVAVVREVGGILVWYILQSGTNSVVAMEFGIAGDRIVPTDRDGDGRAEITVFRPSTGTWYFLANYTTFSAAFWGTNGDIPAPADYDGDEKTDLAVWRPSTQAYYLLRSSNGTIRVQPMGLSTDQPIEAAYVR